MGIFVFMKNSKYLKWYFDIQNSKVNTISLFKAYSLNQKFIELLSLKNFYEEFFNFRFSFLVIRNFCQKIKAVDWQGACKLYSIVNLMYKCRAW